MNALSILVESIESDNCLDSSDSSTSTPVTAHVHCLDDDAEERGNALWYHNNNISARSPSTNAETVSTLIWPISTWQPQERSNATPTQHQNYSRRWYQQHCRYTQLQPLQLTLHVHHPLLKRYKVQYHWWQMVHRHHQTHHTERRSSEYDVRNNQTFTQFPQCLPWNQSPTTLQKNDNLQWWIGTRVSSFYEQSLS